MFTAEAECSRGSSNQPVSTWDQQSRTLNTEHWDDLSQGGRMTNRGAVSNTEAPQCSSRGSPSHPSISQVTPSTHLISNISQYISHIICLNNCREI